MRPTLLMLAVISALPTCLLAAPVDPPAKTVPVKPRTSPELREALGPVIRVRGFLNRAKVYPAFGTTNQEGHAGFACWEEGIAVWGPDVLDFLAQAGVPAPIPSAPSKTQH